MWEDYDGDGSYPHDDKQVKCSCGEGYKWTDDELVRKLRKNFLYRLLQTPRYGNIQMVDSY